MLKVRVRGRDQIRFSKCHSNLFSHLNIIKQAKLQMSTPSFGLEVCPFQLSSGEPQYLSLSVIVCEVASQFIMKAVKRNLRTGRHQTGVAFYGAEHIYLLSAVWFVTCCSGKAPS